MIRILLVEDSPSQAQELMYILHDAGFQAEWTTTAEEALLWVHQKPFDLVLTDLFLPGENGIDLCRRIKAHPDHQQLVVVMITRSSNPVNLLMALEAGSDGFMTKKIPPADLVSRILHMLASTTQRPLDPQPT